MTSNDKAMSLTSHLVELRKRLMIACAAWLVAFLGCYNFAEDLFQLIAGPANSALPEGSTLVFISATEPFFAYLKVAAIAGLLISLPIILWQVWAFAAPGLKAKEKKLAIPFVAASCLCFAVGTYFGFEYVFPQIFSFLIEYGLASGQLSAMLSMAAYLSLSSHLLLAFGMVFELPVIMFFLARIGIVDYKWLAKKRKYAFLTAFVIGATLTPPDPISQLAIAGPFVLLFELGIWIARLFGKKRSQD